ncbi:MAG TPA: cytochrome c [Bryobacteraceae bacterium]|nr:cytochrome c [Bryobacteraceae bacterium]
MSRAWLAAAAMLACAACRQDMFEQPKYRALDPSAFFADGRSARPVPPGTFRYDEPEPGEAVEEGTSNGTFVASIPLAVNHDFLERGRTRFDVYCSPCHGRLGDGHGMIAQRGFLQPADLNGARVRNAPPGYIYAVIAHGYGSMPDYGDQIPNVRDRWAIVAYIRALELSRQATLADVPPEQRPALEKGQ